MTGGSERGTERARSRSTPDRPASVLPFPRARPAAGDLGEDREPAPRLRSVIGEVLREERQRQRRTLADVAERSAVSLPYLSEIERGRKEVSSELLGAVCDALDLPLVQVLERSAGRLRARPQGGSGLQLRAA